MGTLKVRTDEAVETALRALAEGDGKPLGGRRHAILHTYRDMLLDQAAADADRLRDDPDDRAEMAAIQRFMGVAG
ncbi:hypothetical protein GCM10009733_033410 [Nonomuraea maheshkhaliensis]|uniref:CopG family transcriptional regulator n=1 Tax=Nonomuraea maheshkhaliensis TaxID=419590 RepID=A0ABN2F7T6_9ACTN